MEWIDYWCRVRLVKWFHHCCRKHDYGVVRSSGPVYFVLLYYILHFLFPICHCLLSLWSIIHRRVGFPTAIIWEAFGIKFFWVLVTSYHVQLIFSALLPLASVSMTSFGLFIWTIVGDNIHASVLHFQYPNWIEPVFCCSDTDIVFVGESNFNWKL